MTGVDVPAECQEGHFCPDGTRFATQNPCPLGTYSNKTKLVNASQCHPCDGGWFCDVAGLTKPSGQCDPGFFCTQRASFRQPPDDASGGLCPLGHYCPLGTTTPLNCPIGTYGPVKGRWFVRLSMKLLTLRYILPVKSSQLCRKSEAFILKHVQCLQRSLKP